MNRPLKRTYEIRYSDTFSITDWDMYCKDLEKYCSYLERRNKVLNGSNKFLRDMDYELEKGIDWACFWLRYFSENSINDGCFGHDFDEEQWKEWLLTDDGRRVKKYL